MAKRAWFLLGDGLSIAQCVVSNCIVHCFFSLCLSPSLFPLRYYDFLLMLLLFNFTSFKLLNCSYLNPEFFWFCSPFHQWRGKVSEGRWLRGTSLPAGIKPWHELITLVMIHNINHPAYSKYISQLLWSCSALRNTAEEGAGLTPIAPLSNLKKTGRPNSGWAQSIVHRTWWVRSFRGSQKP